MCVIVVRADQRGEKIRAARRALSGMGVLALVSALAGLIISAMPLVQAAPAYPGVPGEPEVVFEERFENTEVPVSVDLYKGPVQWISPMYTAEWSWLPFSKACNGWVASSGDAPPGPGSERCAGTWDTARAMAWVLGKAQGMSDAEADTNHAVIEHTALADQTQEAGIILKSRKNAAKATPGRFYAVSAHFAATSCAEYPQGNPNLRFSLLLNGNPAIVANGLTPCASSPVQRDGHDVWTKQLFSSAMLVEKNVYLGFQFENMTATGIGNDFAIDLPQMLDVTPRLDQRFITLGTVTNLTYTITNTQDRGAKQGWSFSAQLPAWASVAGSTSTTCGDAVSVDGATVSVSGHLKDGEMSCTVTVPVQVSPQGPHTLGPDSIVSITGLDMPEPATTTVQPSIPPVVESGNSSQPETIGQVPGSTMKAPGTADASGSGKPQVQTGGRTDTRPQDAGLAVGFFLAGLGAGVIIQRRVFAR